MQGRDYTPDENARIAVAEQLRRMSHELMRGDHDPASLHEMAGRLQVESNQLAARPDRVRDRRRFEDPDSMPVPEDGEAFFNAPDRPISGVGTAWSIPLHVIRHGDRAVTDVVLEPGFEGAPGMAHGGIVAAIYDDLLGFLNMLHGKMAFTAALTVNYHAGTMIGAPLHFEAWIERIEGRKMFLAADCHSGDELISSCTSLFIDATDHFAALASAAEN